VRNNPLRKKENLLFLFVNEKLRIFGRIENLMLFSENFPVLLEGVSMRREEMVLVGHHKMLASWF